MCAGRAGKAKYDPKKHALVWKVKRYQGASEHALTATVELLATTRERRAWARPPIALAFQARRRSQRSRGGAGWGWRLPAPVSPACLGAAAVESHEAMLRSAVPRALVPSSGIPWCAPENMLLSTSSWRACAVPKTS